MTVISYAWLRVGQVWTEQDARTIEKLSTTDTDCWFARIAKIKAAVKPPASVKPPVPGSVQWHRLVHK